MTARTDIHRPVEMDPAEYGFIACIDNSPEPGCPGWVSLMGDFGVELSRKIHAGPTGDRGTFQCHHCGARIRYGAILEHSSGDVIVVGETCLDNRFALESKAQFDRLRKAAELDRQKQRIKTAATEYVTDLLETNDPIAKRLGAAMERDADLTNLLKPGWAIDTFTDIRRKVWNTYGQPTDRQQDLLIRLLAEGEDFHAAQAARAEEAPEVRTAAPLGRVDFEGEVVFRKGYESDFGYTIKIIVKVTEADGSVWTVFVTEPSAIETAKGDIIRLRATLKPGRSESEAKGSRPSNAEVVTPAGEDSPSALD